MRTTVRVDDDLMQELKEYAYQQGISMAQLFNRTVRAGLQTIKQSDHEQREPYHEKTYKMGTPKVEFTNYNHLAAELEDAEIIRKLRQGK